MDGQTTYSEAELMAIAKDLWRDANQERDEDQKRYRLVDWTLTVTNGANYATITACLRASDGTTKHKSCVL